MKSITFNISTKEESIVININHIPPCNSVSVLTQTDLSNISTYQTLEEAKIGLKRTELQIPAKQQQNLIDHPPRHIDAPVDEVKSLLKENPLKPVKIRKKRVCKPKPEVKPEAPKKLSFIGSLVPDSSTDDFDSVSTDEEEDLY